MEGLGDVVKVSELQPEGKGLQQVRGHVRRIYDLIQPPLPTLFKINVGLDLICSIKIWWETRLQGPFPQQGAGETV